MLSQNDPLFARDYQEAIPGREICGQIREVQVAAILPARTSLTILSRGRFEKPQEKTMFHSKVVAAVLIGVSFACSGGAGDGDTSGAGIRIASSEPLTTIT